MNRPILIIIFTIIAFTSKAQYTIDGFVYYDSQSVLPIADVSLQLKRTSDNTNIGTAFLTGSTGYFKFVNIPSGKYVFATSTTHPVGGIDATDALLVIRYFINIYSFTDNLRKLAANVNADNQVNPADALLINRRFIQILNTFKAGDWLFEKDSINVSGGNITHNIKALCYGDVNGSYILTNPIKCGENLVDSRDGKSYTTVQIGTQCWMKQNLNIGIRIDSMTNHTDNGIIEKHCYRNEENNCDVYGGLYQWNEAMQYVTADKTQGICPSGWHLPSDREWSTLTSILGGMSVSGGKMKEAGISHWASPNSGATNSSGFSALPGGWRNADNSAFYFLGLAGYWWTTTIDSGFTLNVMSRSMFNNDIAVIRDGRAKFNSFMVRCIMD